MNEHILTEITFLMQEKSFDEGQTILKRGDVTDRVHILWYGRIIVEVCYNDEVAYFDTIKRGACFSAFTSFSDDTTQMLNYKIKSQRAVIYTIKTKHLHKLGKSYIELADRIR